MKTVLLVILSTTLVLGEVTPPYSTRGFRPSPQFSRFQNAPPIRKYIPPSADIELNRGSNSRNVQLIPSKLTIEQLISLTEKVSESSKSAPIPSTAYGVPERQVYNFGKIVNSPQHSSALNNNLVSSRPQTFLSPPSSNQAVIPQPAYGPPKNKLQTVPQKIYGVPSRFQNKPSNSFQPLNHQSLPQVSYGVPDRFHLRKPGTVQIQASLQTSYDGTIADAAVLHHSQPIPQTTYGAPGRTQQEQFRPAVPQSQYGAPGTRGLETFDQINNSNGNAASLPLNQANEFRDTEGNVAQKPWTDPYLTKQYLPTHKAPNFKNNNFIPSQVPQQSFGDARFPGQNVGNSGTNIEIQPVTVRNISPTIINKTEGYLPPSTTSRPLYTTEVTRLRPSARPSVTTTTTLAPDNNEDDEQDTKEQPDYNEEAPEIPNVAISTAVAGGGDFFYLQQPDGRLQKVVYQRTQDPNDRPEEYTANYLFQNIQALPNTLYTPLITLGKR